MRKLNSILFFLFIIWAPLFAQDGVTVDWLFSPASGEVTRAPRFFWIDNGDAIIYDMRAPFAERKFELYNPSTGESSELFDGEKAKESLNAMLENPVPFIWWPRQFSKNGTRAYYIHEGDIFVLTFNGSEFTRVTKTDEEEKSVNFSPDGNKIAYIRENNLFVFDLLNDVETQLTFDGSETILNGTLSWVYWEEIFGRQDIAYWWSDNSGSIAYFRTDESEVDLIHYVDHRTRVQTLIKQRYPKTGDKNPVVTLGVVNVEKAQTTWVDLSGTGYEYIVRVKWLPDSKSVSFETMPRTQSQLDLWFADAATGKVNHILKETDSAWVNIHDDLYFIDGGDKFVWASERTGYNHLYLFERSGELINQITDGEWACRASGGGPFASGAVCAVDEENQLVYFTGQKEGSVEKQLYSVEFDGNDLEKLSVGEGVHRVSFSSDNKFYFDSYSNLSTPTALTLHKSDGELLKVFTEPRLDLVEKYKIVTPELIYIEARDGFELPTTIYKPNNFDPDERYPLILFVYGGPSAPQVQNSWGFWMYINNLFVNKGYVVASVDNRSATGISKTLENSVFKKVSGMNQVYDLVDAVKWFKNEDWIDSSRVGIWGWSGGGSFTLNAMTHTKEFKAGIAVASAPDWKFYDTKFTEMLMRTPDENPEGYAETSQLNSAKDLSGRLLIVHGTYDDNVHIQQVYSFIDQLILADKRFELMIYPMRKHGIADAPAFKHLMNTMIDFWKRNL